MRHERHGRTVDVGSAQLLEDILGDRSGLESSGSTSTPRSSASPSTSVDDPSRHLVESVAMTILGSWYDGSSCRPRRRDPPAPRPGTRRSCRGASSTSSSASVEMSSRRPSTSRSTSRVEPRRVGHRHRPGRVSRSSSSTSTSSTLRTSVGRRRTPSSSRVDRPAPRRDRARSCSREQVYATPAHGPVNGPDLVRGIRARAVAVDRPARPRSLRPVRARFDQLTSVAPCAADTARRLRLGHRRVTPARPHRRPTGRAPDRDTIAPSAPDARHRRRREDATTTMTSRTAA